MAYWLFIVVNAILFIRPAEIVPGLKDAPIYQAAIIACLLCSFPGLLAQLGPNALAARPITVCVLGLWGTAIVSHLVRMNFSDTQRVAEDFGKVAVYYLLFLGVVDTPLRLRRTLFWLAALIAVAAAIAVLQFHDVVDLPGIEKHVERVVDPDAEEPTKVSRLCGPGIFGDPNDLCLALMLCLMVSLYGLTTVRGPARFLWTAPALLAGYAMLLTQSRGGLLGLLAALLVLMWSQYGWRKTLLASIIVVPALVFAGARQTNFDLSNPDDTGQSRIQLWADGLEMFLKSPAFGIGEGMFVEEEGLVAHNSFVHAFSELGFAGGSLFLGAFAYSITTLARLRRVPELAQPAALKRIRPYVLASVVGMAVALMSLSRVYTYPAYIVLAIVSSYLGFASPAVRSLIPRVSPWLTVKCFALGIVFIPIWYLGVTALVRR